MKIVEIYPNQLEAGDVVYSSDPTKTDSAVKLIFKEILGFNILFPAVGKQDRFSVDKNGDIPFHNINNSPFYKEVEEEKMTLEDYKLAISQMEGRHKNELNILHFSFAKQDRRFNFGDIISNGFHKLFIKRVRWGYNGNTPTTYYETEVLNKNGSRSKRKNPEMLGVFESEKLTLIKKAEAVNG